MMRVRPRWFRRAASCRVECIFSCGWVSRWAVALTYLMAQHFFLGDSSDEEEWVETLGTGAARSNVTSEREEASRARVVDALLEQILSGSDGATKTCALPARSHALPDSNDAPSPQQFSLHFARSAEGELGAQSALDSPVGSVVDSLGGVASPEQEDSSPPCSPSSFTDLDSSSIPSFPPVPLLDDFHPVFGAHGHHLLHDAQLFPFFPQAHAVAVTTAPVVPPSPASFQAPTAAIDAALKKSPQKRKAGVRVCESAISYSHALLRARRCSPRL